MPSGRKSLKDEVQVIRYMTELAGPTFDYIKLCITSGDKADKQWGVEQMMKLYPKVIPSEFTNDPDNPLKVTLVNYADIKGEVPTEAVPDTVTESV